MRFYISVRRSGHPLMTFQCENPEEAAALRDAFHTAYYPNVEVTVVDTTAPSEFVEVQT